MARMVEFTCRQHDSAAGIVQPHGTAGQRRQNIRQAFQIDAAQQFSKRQLTIETPAVDLAGRHAGDSRPRAAVTNIA